MRLPIAQEIGTAEMGQAKRLGVEEINAQKGRHLPSLTRKTVGLGPGQGAFDAIGGQGQHQHIFQGGMVRPAGRQLSRQGPCAAATGHQKIDGKLCQLIAHVQGGLPRSTGRPAGLGRSHRGNWPWLWGVWQVSCCRPAKARREKVTRCRAPAKRWRLCAPRSVWAGP